MVDEYLKYPYLMFNNIMATIPGGVEKGLDR
jgi:hypothetical protein